jgi:hypothetical protein
MCYGAGMINTDAMDARDVIRRAMAEVTLNERQRFVFNARFFEGLTLRQISKKIKVKSRERVRQIINDVLRRLRCKIKQFVEQGGSDLDFIGLKQENTNVRSVEWGNQQIDVMIQWNKEKEKRSAESRARKEARRDFWNWNSHRTTDAEEERSRRYKADEYQLAYAKAHAELTEMLRLNREALAEKKLIDDIKNDCAVVLLACDQQ